MKNLQYIPTLLIATSLFAGCSSIPDNNPKLDAARNEFQAAQSDPSVTRSASLELKQASDALDAANKAWMEHDSDEHVDSLAYIATKKVEIAEQVAKQKTAEMTIANATKDQDKILLEQRTKEADQAEQNTSIAKDQAKAAENQAVIAQDASIDALQKQKDAEMHANQLQEQLTALAAKQTPRGIVVTLGNTFFKTDQARLNTNGMHNAQQLADILKQNPQRVVLVEGYTDSTGGANYNQELSERRASSVGNVLMEMGISQDRITTRGYGDADPVASNTTASGRQLNRRVEIVLSGDDGKIPSR